MTVATSLSGTRFERTLLSRPEHPDDTTTRVTWLQGRALYCDLRQPAALPKIEAPALRALGIGDLLVLADQDGFAGPLFDNSDHVEWGRTVALHPAGPTPDAGALNALDHGTLVEQGIFEDYIEHWRIAATSPDIDEYLLEDLDTGAPGVVVRVGGDFAFARGRTHVLDSPPLDSPLHEQIRGAASLRAAQELFDCEIALGVVRDEQWIITASSLPYRVGAHLNPVFGDRIGTRDHDLDGNPVVRNWQRLDLDAGSGADLRRIP
ncbi:hypothetical protein [Rhodococcus artemisiae]|uniref:Uncharacterized protein n=1 Tax=Rhodococcus artemisiae TaxID=714159 RepID=A0ABU7LJM3_9NOCA|nr:hypothetical protein [Rhodococcus artemisiae]MEE2061439.1 hypothetical protein [Rhodococcus artemisiae]